MIACLIVHCFAFGAGLGLIGGPTWIPLGIVIGAAVALWDERQERRADHSVVVTRARRGGAAYANGASLS